MSLESFVPAGVSGIHLGDSLLDGAGHFDGSASRVVSLDGELPGNGNGGVARNIGLVRADGCEPRGAVGNLGWLLATWGFESWFSYDQKRTLARARPLAMKAEMESIVMGEVLSWSCGCRCEWETGSCCRGWL